jgi:hypothetical protein
LREKNNLRERAVHPEANIFSSNDHLSPQTSCLCPDSCRTADDDDEEAGAGEEGDPIAVAGPTGKL